MKPMNFAAVRGKGNPNVEGGDYQRAISVLLRGNSSVNFQKREGDFNMNY